MRVPSRAIMAVAVLPLVVTACAGESPDPGAAAIDDGGDSGDSVALRFGHVYDPEHPNQTCGAEPLAAQLAEDGSGLDVEVFPAAQLGTEEEMLEQVSSGSLELSIAGPSFLGVWHEQAAVFDAAYALRDVDQFEDVVNGEIGQQVWDDLREASGLRVLGSWYYGTRHITADKPVRAPEDLAGVKLRVPNAPLYMSNTEAMGGTATPVALGEAYLGLQQGVIDAQENPIPTIETMKFHEVQDYLSLTGHIVQGTMVVIGEETFQGLTPDQQEALSEVVTGLAGDVRDCVETQEQEVLEEWRESDAIEVVDDVDLDAFRTQTRDSLPDQFSWGQLYREIQDEG